MTLDDQRRTIDEPLTWLVRLKRARLVIGAAALVFLGLEVVGAASLIDFTGADNQPVAIPSHESKPIATDWLVEAVVSGLPDAVIALDRRDRKSTRLNSSHVSISYAVFCLK